MSTFNTAIGAVGSFVAAHSEILPERVELSVASILRWLKKNNKPVTLANMEEAWAAIVSIVEILREPEAVEPQDDPEVEKYRKQIDGWSAEQMREYCKDPEVLAAVEAVLKHPRPKRAATPAPKVEPKPTPKAKPTLTAEEQALESMSADAMKKALQDPVKARGIEDILARMAAKRDR